MAKVIVRKKNYYPLAYFLWNTATFFIHSQKASPGHPFTLEGPEKYLFVASTHEMPVAVAIFADDPLKIVVFDKSIFKDLKKVLARFKSEETIVIEIQ